MDNVIGLDGKPKKPNPTPTCHMRLCLIASDESRSVKSLQYFFNISENLPGPHPISITFLFNKTYCKNRYITYE